MLFFTTILKKYALETAPGATHQLTIIVISDNFRQPRQQLFRCFLRLTLIISTYQSVDLASFSKILRRFEFGYFPRNSW